VNRNLAADCVGNLLVADFRHHACAGDGFVNHLRTPFAAADRPARALYTNFFGAAGVAGIHNTFLHDRTWNVTSLSDPLAAADLNCFAFSHRFANRITYVFVARFCFRAARGAADVFVAGLVHRLADIVAYRAMAGLVHWFADCIALFTVAGLIHRLAHAAGHFAVAGLIDRFADVAGNGTVAGLIDRLADCIALISVAGLVDVPRA